MGKSKKMLLGLIIIILLVGIAATCFIVQSNINKRKYKNVTGAKQVLSEDVTDNEEVNH